MSNYYESYPRFLVSVDCIIFGFSEGKLKLLIQQRQLEPGKGLWSLMGGFVKKEESVSQAASRVLFELTGLHKIYMEQLGAYGDVERDPGERVVSVAYYALINVNEYDSELSKEHFAKWVDVDELPELCFDHNEMVRNARKAMKDRIKVEPIGYNLLPEHFTLTQLQSLYESIMGESIDKRNFRRSILYKDYLIKTDLIDKKNSRRGAVLYKYNDKHGQNNQSEQEN